MNTLHTYALLHTLGRTDLIDPAVAAIAARSSDQHETHVAELAAVRTELTDLLAQPCSSSPDRRPARSGSASTSATTSPR